MENKYKILALSCSFLLSANAEFIRENRKEILSINRSIHALLNMKRENFPNNLNELKKIIETLEKKFFELKEIIQSRKITLSPAMIDEIIQTSYSSGSVVELQKIIEMLQERIIFFQRAIQSQRNENRVKMTNDAAENQNGEYLENRRRHDRMLEELEGRFESGDINLREVSKLNDLSFGILMDDPLICKEITNVIYGSSNCEILAKLIRLKIVYPNFLFIEMNYNGVKAQDNLHKNSDLTFANADRLFANLKDSTKVQQFLINYLPKGLHQLAIPDAKIFKIYEEIMQQKKLDLATKRRIQTALREN